MNKDINLHLIDKLNIVNKKHYLKNKLMTTNISKHNV